MEKKNLVILFGGQSSEHEVSCKSVVTIAKAVDYSSYDTYLVGITKEGRWLLVNGVKEIEDGSWIYNSTTVILSPDATKKEFLIYRNGDYKAYPVDVVFPVLHGLHGEDGTVQGLLELAKIPYVGCGVVASAVSMDKLHTKLIASSIGVAQANYVGVHRNELKDMEQVVKRVEASLPYPVFVKPSNAGSSRGVSKATDRESLKVALEEAAKHDSKILVEETIVGREIECGVLGGREIKASGVGEVVAASEAVFYDYDAKYNNAESRTEIHPTFPEGKEEEIRRTAVEIFKAVDGYGLARVDFFLEKETNRVVFNEINTMPGFTTISMYPMLWDAKGVDVANLVEMLIQLALRRYEI